MTSEDLIESTSGPVVYRGRDELEAALGTELGPTDWLTIEQDRVDGFADDTDDHQWIHVDPERAAASPFGGTIAHGFLTLSLVPSLVNRLRQVEGISMAVNYGLEKVRFPNPVRVGSRIRARATVVACDRVGENALQVTTRATIEVEGSEKPGCVAELVVRYFYA
jgi:acyl dehydratase